jgi:PAS domain S-box-containing protein
LHTGREQNIECLLRAKNGESIPVLFSASMMQAVGHARDIICVALDIRSRKKAERDLEQAYRDS